MSRFLLWSAVVCLAAAGAPDVKAHAPSPPQAAAASASTNELYAVVRSMALTGGRADVSGLVLKRDRVTMTFTGTFYFAAPAGNRVMGAVFVGQGTMQAETPPAAFEREQLKRLIGSDVAESDFRTAVLRWSDDTFEVIGAGRQDAGEVPAQAARLAAEFDGRFATETGANVSARLALSVLNEESPGVFVAQFDGGRRNRFSYVLDHQGRIPVAHFGLNGGEKGLLFQHQTALAFNEVWTAFYAEADYARNAVEYSDVHDLVDVEHYALTLDLRQFRRQMGISGRIDLTARKAGVLAVPFKIGESLSSRRERLENQLRMKSVRLEGEPLAFAQEDWDGSVMVFLPSATTEGQRLSLEVEFEGDFMTGGEIVPECYYPRNNVTWLPRHGYLDRATFDLTFRHRTIDNIAAVGTPTAAVPDPADPQTSITRYQMAHPVALVVFALGPFERKTQEVTWEAGGTPIPLTFFSVPSRITAIKHEFILAELDNSVRYFAAMFGSYPYDGFGAAFHPYPFGQGFPSLLMIPPTDREDKHTHSFIAHETAHQWWGNIVAWRSYRDQWLSEGFAEYSGILYAGRRDREGVKAAADLIKLHRDSLKNQPRTVLGLGGGRLNDLGPITYGLRLNSSKTIDAYQTLVYNKGALVLRMLHFLFSNPQTYDDSAFNAMMQDFVTRFRNKSARTEDFLAVANEHFPRTPTAQKFGLPNLNWFFSQWVYGTGLPSYQMEYTTVTKEDGLYVTGTIKQEQVNDQFGMILPLVLSFDGNQQALTTVAARGPSSTFELKVPMKPRRVELDPFHWVLSERTTSRGR